MEETDKPTATFVEDITENDSLEQDDFSDIDEKKLLRKMDLHILPLVSLLYLLSFIDRGNIGNARIEGITVTLNLSDEQFNLCLTIFFITYALFEVPSNIVLKKIGRPSIFIPTIMVAWGTVMTLMGIVQNFSGLFAARFFLGIAEAGLYPGVSYFLTTYYCKREMQFRQALFYGSATTAGAFSGLLAFAIAKMNGVGGYEGWRWIFILEGLLTVVVAVFAYFLMYDYPETARFLTEREKKFVIWRLKNDSNSTTSPGVLIDNTDKSFKEKQLRQIPNFEKFGEAQELSMRFSVKAVLKDWQAYLHVLLFIGIVAPSYGISLFLPSVIKAMGYTNSKAQLLTIPIFIVASICAVIQAWFADKVGIRFIFIAVDLFLALIGFMMAIIGQETTKMSVIYGGVFIAVCGLYSAFPGIVTWHSNNLANSRKRAIGMAFQIGFGNFGGVFSSNFYKADALTLGHSLELAFAFLGFACCVVLALGYNYSNKKRLKALENGEFDHFTDEELYKMGDKSPYYKYRL